MKRADLIRTIEGFGCELVRHGGKHDWYRNPKTGVVQPVPRDQGAVGTPIRLLGDSAADRLQ